MPTSRREFVEKMTVGAAMFGALPLPLSLSLSGNEMKPALVSDPSATAEWDLTWVNKLTGTHKAVFDVPEVEGGEGAWTFPLLCQGAMDAWKLVDDTLWRLQRPEPG